MKKFKNNNHASTTTVQSSQIFYKSLSFMSRPVCENFANHGWCTSTHNCPFSHDIDDILDLEANRGLCGVGGGGGGRRAKRSKRRLKSIAFDSRPTPETDELTSLIDDSVITLTSKDDSHLDTSYANTNGASKRT